jgi:hypothetical protein
MIRSRNRMLLLSLFCFICLQVNSQDSIQKYLLNNPGFCLNYNCGIIKESFYEVFDSNYMEGFCKQNARLKIRLTIDSSGRIVEIGYHSSDQMKENEFEKLREALLIKRFYICKVEDIMTDEEFYRYYNNRFTYDLIFPNSNLPCQRINNY